MSVKPLTAKEAAQIILLAKDPVVMMHVRPDGDTVGTACALVRIFLALGKNAEYICSDKIPKRLEFITAGLKSAESLDNRDLFCVDVASPAQAGELEAISTDAKLLIDHHEVGTPFAPFYIVSGASSSAEVLFDIIEELVNDGHVTLTKEIAAPLFAAISSDTGSFKYSCATASTFRVAARLIETGIDHSEISRLLFSSKSLEQVLVEGYVVSKITLELDGKVAFVTHSKLERESLGVLEEHFETAIDVAREIEGVEVAFVVKETDKGQIKASLRSTGVDVASVAKKLGGGGHVRAAGCTPNAKNVEEAAKMILAELQKIF